jgi:hypothetical protein
MCWAPNPIAQQTSAAAYSNCTSPYPCAWQTPCVTNQCVTWTCTPHLVAASCHPPSAAADTHKTHTHATTMGHNNTLQVTPGQPMNRAESLGFCSTPADTAGNAAPLTSQQGLQTRPANKHCHPASGSTLCSNINNRLPPSPSPPPATCSAMHADSHAPTHTHSTANRVILQTTPTWFPGSGMAYVLQQDTIMTNALYFGTVHSRTSAPP